MHRCDLLIVNAQIVDLFQLRVFSGWVGIRDGRFLYVESGEAPAANADETLDANGRYIVPGLIDSHMHIESSLITPRRFAETVLPWGTTTILSDPHEVGNVAGEAGVRWMIESSQDLPLRVLHSIPSCVPATSPELEWTGEVFNQETIRRLAEMPTVIALGEVMDYMGLLGPSKRLQQIVATAQELGLLTEGHIPTLTGTDLSAYLAQGISSDHTLTFEEKIREQISKGVVVMLQTKSITPENIAVVQALPDPSRVLLITDDIEPHVLLDGHLSRMVTLAIDCGLPPLKALAMAALYPARYLGQRQLGAIAPGYHADFMLLDTLVAFPPIAVYSAGKRVAENGKMSVTVAPSPHPIPAYPALPGALSATSLRVSTPGHNAQVTMPVVTLQNMKTTLTQLEHVDVKLEDGYPVFQDEDGLALAAIFARDDASQFVGIIKNTGFVSGAIATTVAHDSHNLLVIGRDTASIVAAANRVRELDGGVVVAQKTDILAELQLTHFGLLSDAETPVVAGQLADIEASLRSLGLTRQRPFLTLSIMGLTVSPYAKFSDRGIVDTEQRQLVGSGT